MRAAASGLIDALAALLAALLFSGTLGTWFGGRAALALHIGQPDGFWTGPLPFLLGLLGNVVYALPVAFLLVLAPEALGGAGPGKLLTGRRIPSRRPLRRYLLKTAGWWLGLLGLLAAWWPLMALGLLAHALILLGALPLLTGRPALHERL